MRLRRRADDHPAGIPRGRQRALAAVLAVLLVTVPVAAPVLAGEDGPRLEPGRDTMKSRLSDKASDDQRLNDCGVPEDRRGDSRRPTACRSKPQTAGSEEERGAQ